MTAEEVVTLTSHTLREIQDQQLWLAGGGLERGDQKLDLAAGGNASLGASEVCKAWAAIAGSAAGGRKLQ